MGLDQRLWLRGAPTVAPTSPQISSDMCQNFAPGIHDGVLVGRWHRVAMEPSFVDKTIYDDAG